MTTPLVAHRWVAAPTKKVLEAGHTPCGIVWPGHGLLHTTSRRRALKTGLKVCDVCWPVKK